MYRQINNYVLSLMLALLLLHPRICLGQSTDELELSQLQQESQRHFKEHVEPFLTKYCTDCHGAKRMKGGLNFAPAIKNPGGSPFVKSWKNASVNVQTHDMPPEDFAKQPTDDERVKFSHGLQKIKYLSNKDPGYYVIHRLTKVEYANTLRDLFGVDPGIADELPEDVAGEGYLNTLSPLQLEQFLGIANKVLDQILAPIGEKPTEIQQQLFGDTSFTSDDEQKVVRNIARRLAKKAYRRPAAESELDVLVQVYELGQKNKLTHDAALRLMLKAILVSPQFLYITPAMNAKPSKEIIPLDDYQLASRLSYLFWSTIPDSELMNLADQGKLHEHEILVKQVNRLLDDPRSRAFFDGFGAQWLGVDHLDEKIFDTIKFPQMTPELRTAMYDEVRLFFDSMVRENHRVSQFVDADYTYLNPSLAELYGLKGKVVGLHMQRVILTDRNRGGILSMPGILATTSFPNRTSPVKRGVWVLEQVLGEYVPPAPPNVPELDNQDPGKVEKLTLRQRTELHRKNPVCANCHKLLDPIGFGLENFDAIGRWRDSDDSGGLIDAQGELPDSKIFQTPEELKKIIGARCHDLARNLIEKLLAYALCRQLEGYDEIVVDQLLKNVANDDYRTRSIITEVVTSYPFTHYRVREQIVPPSK